MNILRVVEIATFLLAMLMFVTQIFIPLLKRRPLFPWFRREAGLLAKLDALRQQKEEQKLQDQINKEKSSMKHSHRKETK